MAEPDAEPVALAAGALGQWCPAHAPRVAAADEGPELLAAGLLAAETTPAPAIATAAAARTPSTQFGTCIRTIPFVAGFVAGAPAAQPAYPRSV